jgi:hypothetical protein
MDGSGDANSGFCAMLLAMASHHLRQPLHVIDSARDVLVPIHHGASAQAQQARVEYATRQLADKAYGRLRAASAAGDEHATAARRVTDGALSAGWTLPRPRVGPSTRSPQRLPSGREFAAAWLLLDRSAFSLSRCPKIRSRRSHPPPEGRRGPNASLSRG